MVGSHNGVALTAGPIQWNGIVHYSVLAEPSGAPSVLPSQTVCVNGEASLLFQKPFTHLNSLLAKLGTKYDPYAYAFRPTKSDGMCPRRCIPTLSKPSSTHLYSLLAKLGTKYYPFAYTFRRTKSDGRCQQRGIPTLSKTFHSRVFHS